MSTRNLIVLTSGVLLIGTAAFLSGSCSRGARADAGEPKATASAPAVPVTKAKTEDMSRGMVITAEFKPFQEVDVMAKVAGYVKNINVDVGSRVRQGDLLAVLEVPEMANDQDRAQSVLSRSQAEVARARDELQRAGDMGEHLHLHHLALFGLGADRPLFGGGQAHGLDPRHRAEQIDQIGDVVGAHVEHGAAANVVVEGIGDHGCEYMTGGRVVVLGEIGQNFAAGMSGGIAYLFGDRTTLLPLCNQEMVTLLPLDDESEVEIVRGMITRHAEYTGSRRATVITNDWESGLRQIVKVLPNDYGRYLEQKTQPIHQVVTEIADHPESKNAPLSLSRAG